MLEVRHLTKRYGKTLAVDDLTFQLHPGEVTGFLGPNGAGKSTTLRLILGLASPTSGSALINGISYSSTHLPLTEVGAVLDARAFHPARTALAHLQALAASSGIGVGRVRQVLDQVGLSSVARRRVGGFSLGMTQRLGIAAALIGDPPVLLLDEPLTGLDPDGVRWVRALLRSLADQGRVIFLSSHLLGETSITADRLIVIGAGRLIADTTVSDFVAHHATPDVLVRTGKPHELARLLTRLGGHPRAQNDGALLVHGLNAAEIGEVGLQHHILITELTPRGTSLEDAFISATGDSLGYASRPSDDAPPRPPQRRDRSAT